MPAKELYRLAAEFRRANLWARLEDSELFAVQMPDGERVYVSVMGMMGRHLALAGYPGDAGLASYRRLAEVHGAMRQAERFERMLGQDCVACSFEDRAELGRRDLDEIRAHGLSFRGSRAYPLFQRMRPGRAPWSLEDGRDEERLRLCLAAGLEVSRRLSGAAVQQDLFHQPDPGASKLELGFQGGATFDREIPLLTPLPGGAFSWGRAALPPPAAADCPSPRISDDLMLARLRKKKNGGAWACGVMLSPRPNAAGEEDADGFVPEPLEAPRFPYMLLVVDEKDGMILRAAMDDGPEDPWRSLLAGFAEFLEQSGLPREILARDERSFRFLSGIAGQLGVRLTMAECLEALDEAEEQLSLGLAADPHQEFERALDQLLETGAEVPAALKRQIAELLKRGALPEPVADKARRLLSRAEEAQQAAAKRASEKAAGRAIMKAVTTLAEVSKARPAAAESRRAAQEAVSANPGSYVVSASLGTGRYRHIRISADATLFQLHRAILGAFEMEDDHAHAFFLDDKLWSKADAYFSPGVMEGTRSTKAHRLKDTGLKPGAAFKYLFDFGDEWRFQCRVLRALAEPTAAPEVVRDKGGASRPGAPEADEKAGRSVVPEPYSRERTRRHYRKLALPRETVELLTDYFDAFANLYGVIPLKKALEIYNSQNPPVSPEDFAAFAWVARFDDRAQCFILGEEDLYLDGRAPEDPLDREIVGLRILEGGSLDAYEELKAGQRGKPYHVPRKKALLQYGDPDYFEPNAGSEALTRLFFGMGLTPKRAGEILHALRHFAYMGRVDLQGVLDDAGRMGLEFQDVDGVNRFFAAYNDMSNNTRMPFNRGHTPLEMARKSGPPRSIHLGPGYEAAVRSGELDVDDLRKKMLEAGFPSGAFKDSFLSELDRLKREAGGKGPAAPATPAPPAPPAAKAGRNDPCPCGSGRKYKHCCGKKN